MSEKRDWLKRETVERLQETLCAKLEYFARQEGWQQVDAYSKALHRLWEVSRGDL